jgi:ABC-type thiamine transport system ATPase subunit
MALSKLFIPWVPFLLLDESFSACDTEREMAGIGVLASSGFQQTILITHSDAPESMADYLIYL